MACFCIISKQPSIIQRMLAVSLMELLDLGATGDRVNYQIEWGFFLRC